MSGSHNRSIILIQFKKSASRYRFALLSFWGYELQIDMKTTRRYP